MLAISNAGFELTESQRLRRAEINGWFLQVYGPESARLNEAIREAREVHRHRARLDRALVAKVWQLRKEQR